MPLGISDRNTPLIIFTGAPVSNNQLHHEWIFDLLALCTADHCNGSVEPGFSATLYQTRWTDVAVGMLRPGTGT